MSSVKNEENCDNFDAITYFKNYVQKFRYVEHMCLPRNSAKIVRRESWWGLPQWHAFTGHPYRRRYPIKKASIERCLWGGLTFKLIIWPLQCIQIKEYRPPPFFLSFPGMKKPLHATRRRTINYVCQRHSNYTNLCLCFITHIVATDKSTWQTNRNK